MARMTFKSTTKAGNGNEKLDGFVMLKDGKKTWYEGVSHKIAMALAGKHQPQWMRGFSFAADGSRVIYA